MKKICRPQKSNRLFWLLVVILVFISVYGLNYSFHGPNKKSEMGNCIFVDKGSWCSMDIFQHLSLWQQLFTGWLPRFISFLIFASVAVALIVISVWVQRKNTRLPLLADRKLIITLQAYFIQQPDLAFSDPIKQALASGILQPQIFQQEFPAH